MKANHPIIINEDCSEIAMEILLRGIHIDKLTIKEPYGETTKNHRNTNDALNFYDEKILPTLKP